MFRMYDKVGRLGNQDTAGITNGKVYVMPKLDGTNGSVWFTDSIQCGSRKRHLSAEDDNRNFCKSILSGAQGDFEGLFKEVPEWRIYGEWLVPHTVKGYADEHWNTFFVYDVYNGTSYIPPDEYEIILSKYKIQCIPYSILNNPDQTSIDSVRELFKHSFMKRKEVGEGIVLKNFNFINKFGELKFAKVLNEEFNNGSTKKGKPQVIHSTEEALAGLMITEGLVNKTKAKIENFSSKDIAQLLETVWHDAIEEELYDALKKMKWPTVQFGPLRGVVYRKVKEMEGL